MKQIQRVIAVAAAILITSTTAFSQENMKRTELARVAVPESTNTEVVIAEITLQPGARVPLHTHDGEAFTYVLQGGTVKTAALAIREDKTGSLFHFQRDLKHGDFVVVGDNPIKILAINIGDIGSPLVRVVKE